MSDRCRQHGRQHLVQRPSRMIFELPEGSADVVGIFPNVAAVTRLVSSRH
jgi:hypothetical protein